MTSRMEGKKVYLNTWTFFKEINRQPDYECEFFQKFLQNVHLSTH